MISRRCGAAMASRASTTRPMSSRGRRAPSALAARRRCDRDDRASLRVVIGVGEDQIEHMLERDALHFLHRVGEERVEDVGDDQADQARSPERQAAGMGVWGVVVGFDRAANGIPGGGGDRSAVVDDPGDGRGRHAGVAGDIREDAPGARRTRGFRAVEIWECKRVHRVAGTPLARRRSGQPSSTGAPGLWQDPEESARNQEIRPSNRLQPLALVNPRCYTLLATI